MLVDNFQPGFGGIVRGDSAEQLAITNGAASAGSLAVSSRGGGAAPVTPVDVEEIGMEDLELEEGEWPGCPFDDLDEHVLADLQLVFHGPLAPRRVQGMPPKAIRAMGHAQA